MSTTPNPLLPTWGALDHNTMLSRRNVQEVLAALDNAGYDIVKREDNTEPGSPAAMADDPGASI